MKMKKRGVYAALAVVLLITAALIVSCLDVIDPSGLPVSKQDEPITVPEGMGVLKLNFGGVGNGRTALPSAAGIDHYKVVGTVATVDNNGDPIDPGDIEGTAFTGSVSSSGGTIVVEVGVYVVAVTAYANSLETQTIGTGTTTTNVVVTAGGGTANVNLTLAKSSTGTFAWNVTLPTAPDAPTTASLVLKNYTASTGAVGSTITTQNVLTTNSGTFGTPVTSGDYYVTVTLTKAGHADRIKSEVVSIRDYLTTTYTESFSALVENVYTVNYFNEDNLGDTTTPTTTYPSVVHGTDPNSDSTYGFPTPNNDAPSLPQSGYVPGGWYRESSYTNAWRPTDRIIKATDLYLRWVAPIVVTVNLTYDGTELSVTLEGGSNTISFSQANIINNSRVTFRIPSGTITALGLTDIIWKCGERTLTTVADPEVDGELVLDLSDPDNVDLLVLGENYILVTATINSNTKSQSFILEIN